MRPESIRINLEVESGAEPIQGSLRVQDEAPQPFRGWLQLSALLTGAAGGADLTPSDAPTAITARKD